LEVRKRLSGLICPNTWKSILYPSLLAHLRVMWAMMKAASLLKSKEKAYSVILLDEIEKAHPDVFNMLLQILDDGRATDSHGRTVSFENTVLIMTSNAGTSLKASSIGFANDNYIALENKVKEVLKETFRPEF